MRDFDYALATVVAEKLNAENQRFKLRVISPLNAGVLHVSSMSVDRPMTHLGVVLHQEDLTIDPVAYYQLKMEGLNEAHALQRPEWLAKKGAP